MWCTLNFILAAQNLRQGTNFIFIILNIYIHTNSVIGYNRVYIIAKTDNRSGRAGYRLPVNSNQVPNWFAGYLLVPSYRLPDITPTQYGLSSLL